MSLLQSTTSFFALQRWDMANQEYELLSQYLALVEMLMGNDFYSSTTTPKSFTLDRYLNVPINTLDVLNVYKLPNNVVIISSLQAPNKPLAMFTTRHHQQRILNTSINELPSPHKIINHEQILISKVELQNLVRNNKAEISCGELLRILHEVIPPTLSLPPVIKLEFELFSITPLLQEFTVDNHHLHLYYCSAAPPDTANDNDNNNNNPIDELMLFDHTQQILIAYCRRTLAKIISTKTSIIAIPRYNKGTTNLKLATACRAMGIKTRNHWGEISQTSLHISKEEMASDASFLTAILHYADSSTSVVWEVLMDDNHPFNTTLEPDGRRKFIVFWRAGISHIFARPQPGECLQSRNYLSKIGKTSFQFTAEFFTICNNKHKNEFPIARVDFTMSCVERLTNKSVPVFFDIKFAQQRYPMCLSTAMNPFTEQDSNNMTWSKKIIGRNSRYFIFNVQPYILHRFQDLNGHINSGRYMFLIHEARDACLLDHGFLSKQAREVMERENGWITSFGLDFSGEVKREDPVRIRICYDVKEQQNNLTTTSTAAAAATSTATSTTVLFVFQFLVLDKVFSTIWVESNSSYSWGNSSSNDKTIIMGCDPEQWGYHLTTSTTSTTSTTNSRRQNLL
jgi:acyl-CoA thioesterase FadM